MRLAGPIFEIYTNPDEWASAVKSLGYRAAYCPVGLNATDDEINAYRHKAKEEDIVIAEVGAWSNPMSRDETIRNQAIVYNKSSLRLADKIGARCCVNISGSRGEKWDGPNALDMAEETFEMIVHTVQDIIDAVNPQSAYYTLETMPWMMPDSVESYQRLIDAIDRPKFGVHFDPVNLVNSPRRYFANADMMREFVDRLGAKICSVHAKDILLGESLTIHLDEVRPGLGELDYPVLLRALDSLDPDIPLMVEHLPSADEYDLAVNHIRSVADSLGITL